VTPQEALDIARKHVAALYEVKNDRGYPRFQGSVHDVLSQELAVAEFLLNNSPDDA
jgi:hypothetical protein